MKSPVPRARHGSKRFLAKNLASPKLVPPALTRFRAAKIVATFCSAAIFFLNSSCDENGTPDWKAYEVEEAGVPETPAAPRTAEPATTPAKASAQIVHGEGLRFIAYNVENWLTMDRYVDRTSFSRAPKPEAEKRAVVQILVRHTPDVIGLCEIGDAADLAEIQEMLKVAGLNLPHSHFTGGSDPTRHLGLLSRFPITSTAKPAAIHYQLAGKTYAITRGILDATVQTREKSYRFVGAHLKSKRDIEQGDQEGMRLNEARLLRCHVDNILKSNFNARIIVYGDLNDTRASRSIKTITGNYNDPSYLTAIPAKDSNQHAWTYHWVLHDIYSRIDFIMVTRGLRAEVDFTAARIVDDEGWDKASDHRPLLAVFR